MIRQWGVWINLTLLLLGTSAFASSKVKGFVNIPGSKPVYVDYTPADEGQPTVVELNGLTWNTGDWRPMLNHMSDEGIGQLLYDPAGMGRTRDRFSPYTEVISDSSQVEDLHKLFKVLGIKGKVFLNGLSYGGGLALLYAATYPDEVAGVIAEDPYTAPVRIQDQYIKWQIFLVRHNPMNPLNIYDDDALYDLLLQTLINQSYAIAEPEIMKGNLAYNLAAVFRLVQGIRKFHALDVAKKFPDNSIHLMVGTADQYISQGEYNDFWRGLPKSKRASRLDLIGVQHALPTLAPQIVAAWVTRIVRGDPEISGGRTFKVSPTTVDLRKFSGGNSCDGLF